MKSNIRLLLLPVLIAMLLAHVQQAYATDYMKDDINYQVIGGGPSAIFMIPVYDKDGRDMWAVTPSMVIVKKHGAVKGETLFMYNVKTGNIDGDAKDVVCYFQSYLGGTLKVKDKSGNWVNVPSSGVTVTIHSNNDGFSADLQWDAPYEWRGIALDFIINVKGDQNNASMWTYEKSFNNITLSAPPAPQKPSIVASVISTSSANPKSVAVTWQISANEVSRAVAHYKVDGAADMQTLANEPYGTFYVPSDKLVTDLYVEVDYKDVEGNAQAAATSDHQDILPFHQARSLSPKVNADGSVNLSWSVSDADRTDIMPTDYFLIQRNTKGLAEANDANWQSIGQVAYTANQKDYEFKDETLLSNFEDALVVYRVQRASVTSIWGYGINSGVAQTVLPQHLVLPRPKSLEVVKDEKTWTTEKHAVDVSWTLDENKAKPVSAFTISNVDDWTRFCARVSSGVHVDAVLTSDLDLKDCQEMVGNKALPFTGTFDGQGHTLTIHYSTGKNYTAPFRFLGDGAVIKNLTVAGDIYTEQLCVGGIAALASGTDIQLQRCRSLVNIHSSKTNSAVYYGGLLGALYNNGTACGLMLEDCLFDGMLYGTNLFLCGGMIGWSDKSNSLTLRRVAMRRVGSTQVLVDYDNTGAYHQAVPLPVND